MGTIQYFSPQEITNKNPQFSSFKVLIETAFYSNNVELIPDLTSAYKKAFHSRGVIVTDMPVKYPKKIGLPSHAKMLLFNDGQVVGRTSAARVVIGESKQEPDYYEGILREALYQAKNQTFYQGNVLVGLHEDFMVRSHLLIPEGFEMNLYSYLLNFQIENDAWSQKYQASTKFNENDIYIFANPEWSHPDFPNGLALFDPTHNVAAILGLRYFGELKKATLTLAWGTAHRQNFVACHGGLKQYHLKEQNYTMAVFGLSGSGKSTITLAPHHNYQVDVLHDDAFIVNKTTSSSIALEPAYFDKTQDYSLADTSTSYFLTMQNVGVTLDQSGKKVPVLQDIRNGNGRTVKSRFSTPHRLDYINEKLNAIF